MKFLSSTAISTVEETLQYFLSRLFLSTLLGSDSVRHCQRTFIDTD